jgi:transposase-like protein
MARAKWFSAEKLREAESLQARGATIPAVCKKLGVSEQTFYRWRTKYGVLKGTRRIG